MTVLTGLSPLEAHAVFRAVQEALARPGTPVTLQSAPDVPTALLPLLALADLGTPTHVDDEWSELVRLTTSAPVVPLPDARLVALDRPLGTDGLRSLRRGSILAPEDGAFVCLGVTAFHGSRFQLRGPGVRDSAVMEVAGLPVDFAAVRADLVAGFPAGVDFLFVTPGGTAIGLPRSTRLTEVNG